MVIFTALDAQKQWSSGNLRTGSGTSHGNLPFTLYLLKSASGFSDDSQGTKHYIDMCKKHRTLPIGCGTEKYNCDRNRHIGEPCVPMPKAWGCNMMSKLKEITKWGSNIVAIQSDADESGAYLFKPGNHPDKNDHLQPVCGLIAGMF